MTAKLRKFQWKAYHLWSWKGADFPDCICMCAYMCIKLRKFQCKSWNQSFWKGAPLSLSHSIWLCVFTWVCMYMYVCTVEFTHIRKQHTFALHACACILLWERQDARLCRPDLWWQPLKYRDRDSNMPTNSTIRCLCYSDIFTIPCANNMRLFPAFMLDPSF